MPTIEVTGRDLLKAVEQLGEQEFEKFIEQALSLRAGKPVSTLSARETDLLRQINRGLPLEIRKRYAQLALKRRKRTLTPSIRSCWTLQAMSKGKTLSERQLCSRWRSFAKCRCGL